MPRIGKGAPAAPSIASTVTGPPPEYDPADVFTKNRQDSHADTRDTLVRTAKRIRSTTGRIRRAKFLVAVDTMRMQNFSPRETAEILGCSYQQVTGALMTIRKNADTSAQLNRLDQIGIPLAVDNVLNGIRDGDKEFTLRLMDGRGMFRTHKSIDAQVTQTHLELKISVVMPDHYLTAQVPPPRPGSIVGSPMTFDAVVVPNRDPVPVPALPALGIGTPDLS